MKALDDALLAFYEEWVSLMLQQIDGTDVGPQDWDAAFLEEIAGRMPELREKAEHAKLIRMLNEAVGSSPEPVANDTPRHADPPA